MQLSQYYKDLSLTNISLQLSGKEEFLHLDVLDQNTETSYEIKIELDFIQHHDTLPLLFQGLQHFKKVISNSPNNLKLLQGNKVAYLLKTGMKTVQIILPAKKKVNKMEQLSNYYSSIREKELITKLTKIFREQIIQQTERIESKFKVIADQKIRKIQQKFYFSIDQKINQLSICFESLSSEFKMMRNEKPRIEDSAAQAFSSLCTEIKLLNEETEGIQKKFNYQLKFLQEKMETNSQKIIETSQELKFTSNKVKELEVENLKSQKDLFLQVKDLVNNSIFQVTQKLNLTNRQLQVLELKFQKHFVELKKSQLHYIKEEPLIPIRIPYINDHSFNPHSDRFQTNLKSDSLQIIYLKEYDNKWYNFIKNQVILNNALTSHRIRQLKTKDCSICTGIATKQASKMLNAYQDKTCVVYSHDNGHLWVNGCKKRIGKEVMDDQIVVIEVDTMNWQIKWIIDDQEFARTSIPLQMQKCELFLVILMYDKHDKVQLLLNK